jgi:hypothetical protein
MRWLIQLSLLGGVMAACQPLRAQVVIGYGTATQGSFFDSASTSYVFIQQGFGEGGVGLNLASWSFHSGAWEEISTRDVTPMLFQSIGDGYYTVVAIGATVTADKNTVYDQPFNLVEGSTAITGTNFYFGWKDGTTTSANQGVISWDHNPDGPNTAVALAENSSENLALGASYYFGNLGLAERSYRFTATATVIPEPGTYAAWLGLGVFAIAQLRRRTRRLRRDPV